MKKIILMFIAALLSIVLYGCSEAKVYSEMKIFNKSGAGTKTISVNIDRDHKLSRDDRAAGKTNSKFFPKGFEPVRDYIQSKVPDWCEIGFEEKKDFWVYTINYSFKDIDDYNRKTRELIDDVLYEDEDLEPAVLTAVERDGGWNVTFREQTAVVHSIVLGYIADLHFNEEIFDRSGGGQGAKTPKENFSLSRISVKIGNNAQQNFNVSGKYVETTRFISYEENQKYQEVNTDIEQTPSLGETVPDTGNAEPASNIDNTKDLNNDDKSALNKSSRQLQIILLITVFLLAALLSVALTAKKIRSKNHK